MKRVAVVNTGVLRVPNSSLATRRVTAKWNGDATVTFQVVKKGSNPITTPVVAVTKSKMTTATAAPSKSLDAMKVIKPPTK